MFNVCPSHPDTHSQDSSSNNKLEYFGLNIMDMMFDAGLHQISSWFKLAIDPLSITLLRYLKSDKSQGLQIKVYSGCLLCHYENNFNLPAFVISRMHHINIFSCQAEKSTLCLSTMYSLPAKRPKFILIDPFGILLKISIFLSGEFGSFFFHLFIFFSPTLLYCLYKFMGLLSLNLLERISNVKYNLLLWLAKGAIAGALKGDIQQH